MKLAVELYSLSYFAVELYRMRNGCTETHFNLDSVKNKNKISTNNKTS